MVDTKDSKSFAGNCVRVQVSSPVFNVLNLLNSIFKAFFFILPAKKFPEVLDFS